MTTTNSSGQNSNRNRNKAKSSILPKQQKKALNSLKLVPPQTASARRLEKLLDGTKKTKRKTCSNQKRNGILKPLGDKTRVESSSQSAASVAKKEKASAAAARRWSHLSSSSSLSCQTNGSLKNHRPPVAHMKSVFGTGNLANAPAFRRKSVPSSSTAVDQMLSTVSSSKIRTSAAAATTVCNQKKKKKKQKKQFAAEKEIGNVGGKKSSAATFSSQGASLAEDGNCRTAANATTNNNNTATASAIAEERINNKRRCSTVVFPQTSSNKQPPPLSLIEGITLRNGAARKRPRYTATSTQTESQLQSSLSRSRIEQTYGTNDKSILPDSSPVSIGANNAQQTSNTPTGLVRNARPAIPNQKQQAAAATMAPPAVMTSALACIPSPSKNRRQNSGDEGVIAQSNFRELLVKGGTMNDSLTRKTNPAPECPAPNNYSLTSATTKVNIEHIPRPASSSSDQSRNQKSSSRKKEQQGNFVRQNLRNGAGSCRGARNKKTKSKASLRWKQKREEEKERWRNAQNQVDSNGGNNMPRPAQSGIDPMDDFLDGTFNSNNNEKISKLKKANNKDEAKTVPKCSVHRLNCKLVMVKKNTTGNKGRKFYACSMPRGEQCNHFQWADDTVEAARRALLKNSSVSGFIARQTASYMDQFNCLTVPELRAIAKRHSLDDKGKKKQLLVRLSIWVRDQVATTTTNAGGVTTEDKTPGVTIEDENDVDDESETTSEDDDDSNSDCSTSSLEEELVFVDEEDESDEDEVSEGESPVHGRRTRSDIAAKDHDKDLDSQSFDEECAAMCASVEKKIEKGSPPCALRSALRKLFGHSDFREGQEWAIQRCLNKERTLLVAPTGFGKSLCYSLPAALMDGVCIVVSPLLSLIQDQLRFFPPNLPAVTMSGPLSTSSMAATLDDIIRGRIKVVFVSPERLTSASFRRLFRPKWNPETKTHDRHFPVVSLLCVDEAHCLSQWAHNFRPSYLRIQTMIDMIQPQSILAITATAGPRVVGDICRTLKIQRNADSSMRDGNDQHGSEKDGVRVMKTDRDNIDVKCLLLANQEERLSKLISLLLPSPKKQSNETKSTASEVKDGCLSKGNVIIYVWRQIDAEAVAENIQASGIEGGVVVYHGGMDAGARSRAQSKFLRGKARVCVATVAFGMGINKEDVAAVVHLYLSASPEHYLQEIGRAGRDGRPAKAIALVLQEEVLVRHSLAHSDLISKSQVLAFLSFLKKRIKESLSSLREKRSDFEPITISLPLVASGTMCDCKAETIETLVSLLELREISLLQLEGTFYDDGVLVPKKRHLHEIAKGETIVQAINACAKCVEAPAGEVVDDISEPIFTASRNVGGYTFGAYAFSVAQCANWLGPDAQPRHVFAALRRLQSNREVELTLDTSAKGRALNIKLMPEGMRIFGEDGDTALNQVASEIFDLFVGTVNLAANKVIDMDHILNRVKNVSDEDTEEDQFDKSASLRLFQGLVEEYFQAEGHGKALLSNSEYSTCFANDFSLKQIANDAGVALSFLHDLQNSLEDASLLRLGEPASHDYTTLTITKFLHGIAPATVPVRVLRRHHLFGRMQGIRFDALQDAISSLFKPK